MNIQPQTFALAQAGDPVALDQLLRQIRPDILRYARYQCSRSSAVDDVVQEALIILYRRVGAIQSIYALSRWLATVVARLCLLPALVLMRGAEDLAQRDHAAHFSNVPADELRIDLVRALESLPLPYRQVMVLRDMQELTMAEIAAELGVTVAAAKSRLHRARALVREYLLEGA